MEEMRHVPTNRFHAGLIGQRQIGQCRGRGNCLAGQQIRSYWAALIVVARLGIVLRLFCNGHRGLGNAYRI
jgi:hypothetical protein